MSKEFPKITVVTPSYNAERFIEATIRSVLRQNYPNLEYIIVDGGSTDGTVDIIKKYEDQLTEWISEPDDGSYHAIQKGFDRSDGEVMAWLNADDIYPKNALLSVGKIFSSLSRVKWIQGYPTEVDEDGRFIVSPMTRDAHGQMLRWSKYDYYMEDYRWIQQESTFWRRDLWEKAGGYIDTNFKYAADLEVWSRFFRHERLYVTEFILGGYRNWSQEQLSISNSERYDEEAQRVVRRELERLCPQEKRNLRILKWGKKIYRLLKRVDFIDADKFWTKLRVNRANIPPVIRYNSREKKFYYSKS